MGARVTNEEITRLVRLALPHADNTPANRARFAASDNPFEQVAALRMTYEAALAELCAALPGNVVLGFGHAGFMDADGKYLATCADAGISGDFAEYTPDGQLITANDKLKD